MNNRYEQLEDELTGLFYDTTEQGITPKTGVFFDINPLPDNEALLKESMKPRAYIMYDNSDYSETENLSGIVQEDKMKIGVEIHARTRRGDNGIFAIQKIVYSILLGYKPFGCDKLQLVSFGPLLGSKPNAWSYYAQFSTVSHIAESQPEPDINGPALKEITFTNPV